MSVRRIEAEPSALVIDLTHDIQVIPSTGRITLAVVKDGAVAYAKAYGDARISPKMPATPAMRYSIGSVSKQFTASAILLLAQEGKLSLDDKVAKWFPRLTRASEVSIRQLLSRTAGYQDFFATVGVQDHQVDAADAHFRRMVGVRPNHRGLILARLGLHEPRGADVDDVVVVLYRLVGGDLRRSTVFRR